MFGFAKKLVSTLESQLSNESQSTATGIDESRQGLRILSVKPGSIAATHELESWFDFIVALNGADINAYLEINTYTGTVSYDNLFGYIKHEAEVAGNSITFSVFSSKGSIVREITFTAAEILDSAKKATLPLEEVNLSSDTTELADQHSVQWTPSFGVSMQLTPLKAGFYTWHVLHVLPGSPAYLAGIMPDEYIIQSQDGLLATGGEDLLSKVLQSQYAKNGDNCEIVLYVYNHESDCVRPVRVILKAGHLWGGRGILGCDVGYGLLHRIPQVIGKFSHSVSAEQGLPAESNTRVLPEIQLTQEPQFLPLQVSAPSFAADDAGDSVEEAAAAVANLHRKRTQHRNTAINLEAYFDEQTHLNEDKSSSDVKHEGSVPPPPSKQ
ncbi:hypothetical protein CANINC_004117 [Pichia inconspicua]|uniref:PDZ GRASP-type domain-containing protein n=1 Tax=Pichia inconspicua TaxID=52247 RepID=A0A4T0WWR8_9ASCO|nr:hypothetical protein CANINC_004117 [[Candida] inconspicua]